MISWVKKIGVIVLVLAVAHALVVSTGNDHLYPTLQNTLFKGRLGPAIDEYQIFFNRNVNVAQHQPWPENKSNKALIHEDEKLHAELKSVAFLVIKDGEIRYEKYWDGYSDSSLSNSFSMAKSFVSIALGCALQEGKIKSLDQKVGEFLPEFKGVTEVTIKELLMMSSGINFDENYINPFAYPARANYGNDLYTLTKSYKKTEEGGEEFKYLSGNTQLLSFILKEATGQSLSEYLSKNIWQPIGAKYNALWSLDKENGYEKAFCCFNSNARDFARIGQLYLQKGKWSNKQLIPEWYVEQSVIPAPIAEADGTPCQRYGYQWWLAEYEEKGVFYARGILGQYIIVVPEDKLVIVRLGHKRKKPQGYNPPGELMDYIRMGYYLSSE